MDSRLRLTIFFIIACGAILRLLSGLESFWLDEIWTYRLASLLQSPFGILELQHVNNHPLNTLIFYVLGDQANWFLYRIPPIIAGVGSVIFLSAIASREGRPTLIFACLLGSISYPLVLYSGEARGYSFAVLFAVMAYYVYPRQTVRPARALAFSVVCVLGLLSHLTFVFVPAGLGIAWSVRLLRDGSWRSLRALRDGSLLFLVPAVACVALVWSFYVGTPSEVENGVPVAGTFAELTSIAIGVPAIGWLKWVGAAAGSLLFAGGVVYASGQRLGLILITLAVPLTLLLATEPPFLFPRYLLVSVPFFYLAVAIFLGVLWSKSAPGRIASIAIMCGIVAGNALQLGALLDSGRGSYAAAIERLFESADSGQFTVASDHDFRNKAVLDFYARYRPDSQRLVYLDKESPTRTSADFFLDHELDPAAEAPASVSLNGRSYDLIGSYPYSGYSGWQWWLYERRD